MVPQRMWSRLSGGGSILTVVAREFNQVIASDAHGDLIEMYRAIQQGWTPPQYVTEEEYQCYKAWEVSCPLRTFAGYGASFGGKWWGGYGRQKTKDGTMEGVSRGTYNSLMRSKSLGMFDSHVHFSAVSFFDLEVPADASDVVVYADPPYVGTTSYRAVDAFDTPAAWERYHDWARAGANVYISEYTGPEKYQVDAFNPTKQLNGSSSERAPEKLFHIPPV